jgi:hypothetical protein
MNYTYHLVYVPYYLNQKRVLYCYVLILDSLIIFWDIIWSTQSVTVSKQPVNIDQNNIPYLTS